MIDFEKLTDDELLSIWESTNNNEWNDLLGEKPDGFDELPEYPSRVPFSKKLSKSDYTSPIWSAVNYLLPIEKVENHLKKKNNNAFVKFCILIQSDPLISRRSRRAILEHFSKNPD